MRNVSFFAEDYGHEAVVIPIVTAVADQYGVQPRVRRFSVRGGFGQVANELQEYVKDLLQYREDLPDLVVIATDANCESLAARRPKLQHLTQELSDRVVYAIPEPHIERWLLRDPAAFKAVLGAPCKPPDQKCQRDRYKQLLSRAVREAGAPLLLGGIEYAEHLVAHMDLSPTSGSDDFGSFLQELHQRFRLWSPQ